LLIVATTTMPIGNPSIENGYLHVQIYQQKSNGTDKLTRLTLEAPVPEITITRSGTCPTIHGRARVYPHDGEGRQIRERKMTGFKGPPSLNLVWSLEYSDSGL